MKAETKALLDSYKREFAIDKVFNAAYVWGKDECMQAVKKVLYDNLDEIPATDLLTQIDIELSK